MTNVGSEISPKYVVRIALAQYISHPHMTLDNAILKTLAYSDIFDHPLTLEELHRFLTSPAGMQEMTACVQKMDLICMKDGYYFLTGRHGIVEIRKHRELVSTWAYERAHRYGRILGRLPFIRMVTLTGSLAMRNCDQTGDYDYMLVASRGRVWMARIFALLLNKFSNLFGETICPNLIISETILEWKERNLYSAREIAQMKLISGVDVFNSFRVANDWIQGYLPNWDVTQKGNRNEKPFPLQRIVEALLNGKLGDKLEAWEMDRKIRKFSKQEGFGIETNFNADVCQGNFDHHNMWTMQRYQERLVKLNVTK
jgi:hypothetical protein